MAIAAQRPYQDRRTGERRRNYPSMQAMWRGADGMRVSWGGIFGGVLVAMGVLLLLTALGLAIGISALDPATTQAGALGTGAGIWAGVSLLLALFIGGMVATRIGAIFDRTTGLFEGVLVWIVTVLLIGYLAGSGIGMLASGAFNLVTGAGQAIGAVMGGGAGDLSSGDVDQMLARLKDPQTARTLASATGLPQQEVQSTLSEVSQRVENARENPAQAAAEVRQGVAQLYDKARTSGVLEQKAQDVQPQATTAAWITFGALVVSLLAAVLGAMAGRRRQPTVIGT